MEITVLGSGGNFRIPRPLCNCKICDEAREKGVPYKRSGNSLFIHDENILIDTPESIFQLLTRENIQKIDTIFLTHYHADHTMGLRILQDIAGEKPPIEDFVKDEIPDLVVNRTTYERAIEEYEFFEKLSSTVANLKILEDDEEIQVGDLTVRNIESDMSEEGEDRISHFLFNSDEDTVFISSDENKFLDLSRVPDNPDLWIKETGYFPETPDGDPLVTQTAVEGPISHEITFEESLDQIRKVKPERVVLTEIEELFRRSFDDYKDLEEKHSDLNIEFSYDGMKIEV